MRFCALNSLENRCISCTIHRKIYESFYVSHFSLICTHASWNIDYYKVRPQTLSILNEKRKTLCLVFSKYGIFWRLFKTFQSLLSLSESDRKWCISWTHKKLHFIFVYKQVEKIISNWIVKKGSENTVFGTKETNPRSGWYFITLKSLSWVNFQSQISKKIFRRPLTSKTSPYKIINYKKIERS